MSNIESLTIAGVPVLVRPPANPSLPAPLIVLWHGFGIANSEEMLAEVLPLEAVQAWKAYLGLLIGSGIIWLHELKDHLTPKSYADSYPWWNRFYRFRRSSSA